MYIIAMYDVDAKRCGKMLKMMRRYLHWIQNSVFEGDIDPPRLAALKKEAKGIMEDQDSLLIFKSRQARWLEKEVVGMERGETDNFL